MTVTLLLTAYQRAKQLAVTLETIKEQTLRPDQIIVVEDGNDGETEQVCRASGLDIDYYCRQNRQVVNIPVPWNIGLRHTESDIVVFQCAEIKYAERTSLEKIVNPVIKERMITAVPRVYSVLANGEFETWYIHPDKPRTCAMLPISTFCQALRTEWALAVGGFDEEYKNYGLDDDDFENRIWAQGVRSVYVDTAVIHQWHPHCTYEPRQYDINEVRYQGVLSRVKAGEQVVANAGKVWGDINS